MTPNHFILVIVNFNGKHDFFICISLKYEESEAEICLMIGIQKDRFEGFE